MQVNDEKNLKFFCPAHRVGIRGASESRVYCRTGGHKLEVDFPSNGNWVYCFDGQTFYPRIEAEKDRRKDICIACEKRIQRRFLCSECHTLYVESEKTQGKQYFINIENNVIPPCPACQKVNSGLAVHLHNCRIIKAEFYTSETDCPFCKNSIFGDELIDLKKNVNLLINRVWSLNDRLIYIERENAKSKKQVNKESETISNSDRNIFVLRQLLTEFEEKTQAVFVELKELKNKIKLLEEKSVLNESFIKYKEEIRQYLESQQPRQVLKYDFPSKIANILNNAPDKIRLVQYPLISGALKQRTNNLELATFYLIKERVGDEERNYAIPAFPRVAREPDFKLYKNFYRLESKILIGELEVIEPAEVKWDREIMGWRLIKIGRIRFV